MTTPLIPQDDFTEITQLIAAARQRAVQTVNTTLIDLYWQVGLTISHKIAAAEWGDGVVAQLAEHLAHTQHGLRGFTRSNLFRMRKFYETYQGDEIVAPLVRQLPWSHNIIILNQGKRPEEREFYLRLAIREQWSKRELERQIKTVKIGRFEPEYLGKLGFYLEALDRGVKKPHEHAASLFVNTCVTYDRLISL